MFNKITLVPLSHTSGLTAPSQTTQDFGLRSPARILFMLVSLFIASSLSAMPIHTTKKRPEAHNLSAPQRSNEGPLGSSSTTPTFKSLAEHQTLSNSTEHFWRRTDALLDYLLLCRDAGLCYPGDSELRAVFHQKLQHLQKTAVFDPLCEASLSQHDHRTLERAFQALRAARKAHVHHKGSNPLPLIEALGNVDKVMAHILKNFLKETLEPLKPYLSADKNTLELVISDVITKADPQAHVQFTNSIIPPEYDPHYAAFAAPYIAYLSVISQEYLATLKAIGNFRPSPGPSCWLQRPGIPQPLLLINTPQGHLFLRSAAEPLPYFYLQAPLSYAYQLVDHAPVGTGFSLHKPEPLYTLEAHPQGVLFERVTLGGYKGCYVYQDSYGYQRGSDVDPAITKLFFDHMQETLKHLDKASVFAYWGHVFFWPLPTLEQAHLLTLALLKKTLDSDGQSGLSALVHLVDPGLKADNLSDQEGVNDAEVKESYSIRVLSQVYEGLLTKSLDDRKETPERYEKNLRKVQKDYDNFIDFLNFAGQKSPSCINEALDHIPAEAKIDLANMGHRLLILMGARSAEKASTIAQEVQHFWRVIQPLEWRLIFATSIYPDLLTMVRAASRWGGFLKMGPPKVYKLETARDSCSSNLAAYLERAQELIHLIAPEVRQDESLADFVCRLRYDEEVLVPFRAFLSVTPLALGKDPCLSRLQSHFHPHVAYVHTITQDYLKIASYTPQTVPETRPCLLECPGGSAPFLLIRTDQGDALSLTSPLTEAVFSESTEAFTILPPLVVHQHAPLASGCSLYSFTSPRRLVTYPKGLLFYLADYDEHLINPVSGKVIEVAAFEGDLIAQNSWGHYHSCGALPERLIKLFQNYLLAKGFPAKLEVPDHLGFFIPLPSKDEADWFTLVWLIGALASPELAEAPPHLANQQQEATFWPGLLSLMAAEETQAPLSTENKLSPASTLGVALSEITPTASPRETKAFLQQQLDELKNEMLQQRIKSQKSSTSSPLSVPTGKKSQVPSFPRSRSRKKGRAAALSSLQQSITQPEHAKQPSSSTSESENLSIEQELETLLAQKQVLWHDFTGFVNFIMKKAPHLVIRSDQRGSHVQLRTPNGSITMPKKPTVHKNYVRDFGKTILEFFNAPEASPLLGNERR